MEFLRYSLVGCIATGVHYFVLFLLVEGGHLRPAYSATIGSGCGALVAYWGNRRFTFSSASPHWSALSRFLVVAAMGASLSAALVWASTALFAWHYMIGQIAATLLALFFTYGFNRVWTFR